ncbi:MAG: endolytic transglycosylase MltG [Chitinivibrionales bacterium]|nr:endolytic transglycosylase MltG [Chitinivibrionales bacterium]MBD3397279.1 endolytic transglycosylase MltG [Chitinivibrionales bacterium]
MNFARPILRTWFTGLLYCLAGLGYVFYGFLIVVRLLQSRKVLVATAAVLLAAIVAGTLMLVPPGPPGETVEVIVEPGSSVWSVARELSRKNVVASAAALVLWVRMNRLERSMQAGRYVFRENEGILAAAGKLDAAQPLYVTVTIPEGLTIEQTASVCARDLGIDSAAFTGLCYDTAFAAERGVSGRSLEGYLFPNTYRFSPGPSAREVAVRLVDEFDRACATLPDTGVRERFSRREIVTLASIVEKEATLASERPHIAGVFHNRLRLGVPLGADPTVRYALRKFSGPLRVSELNTPSPYNTRLHRGLPPGPICSPGLGALAATVSPMKTDDLYFVARWDGSGAHDFSKTHAEHDRKKHAIRKRNERRKRKISGEKK